MQKTGVCAIMKMAERVFHAKDESVCGLEKYHKKSVIGMEDNMGVRINVSAKQNYSYLFQGLSGANSNLNFLSDYASIKNGSYGKLMKAYYSKSPSKEVSALEQNKKNNAISTSKDSAKTLSAIESAADGLKESADKLITKGAKSLFAKVDSSSKEGQSPSEESVYDVDAIYKGVAAFATDYNKLLDTAGQSNTTGVLNRTKTLVGMTAANEDLLGKVGISINKDNTLSVDEKKFKEADMTTVKSLFNGNTSYAYRVSAQASLIDFAAEKESAKANTYTANGSYNATYNRGNLFDYGF